MQVKERHILRSFLSWKYLSTNTGSSMSTWSYLVGQDFAAFWETDDSSSCLEKLATGHG
jgi:hypothetical protein